MRVSRVPSANASTRAAAHDRGVQEADERPGRTAPSNRSRRAAARAGAGASPGSTERAAAWARRRRGAHGAPCGADRGGPGAAGWRCGAATGAARRRAAGRPSAGAPRRTRAGVYGAKSRWRSTSAGLQRTVSVGRVGRLAVVVAVASSSPSRSNASTTSRSIGDAERRSRARAPRTRRRRGRRRRRPRGGAPASPGPPSTPRRGSRGRPRRAPRRTRTSRRPARRARRAQHAGEADGQPVELGHRHGRGRVSHCAPSPSGPAGRARAARVRSWSSRYLRIVPRVTSTGVLVELVRPSAASACAQSIVSATPGGL